MHIPVMIQARMSSNRLPGKVLMKHRGKTLLDYQLERLKQCSQLTPFILLTSSEPSDDPLEAWADQHEIRCIRGQLENVASRFVDALHNFPCEWFLRHCADRPFLDPQLILSACEMILPDRDLVTNVFPATFPKGITIEIIKSDTFLKSYPSFETTHDFEHVTQFFYRNSSKFRIHNFEALQSDLHAINLCVDTADDFLRFSQIRDLIEKCDTKTTLAGIVEAYHSVLKHKSCAE